MATAPVKSQPLHNFALPHLRWATKNHHHSSHPSNRFRSRDSPDHQSAGCNLPSSSHSDTAAADSDPDNDDSSNAHAAKPPSSRTPRKVFSFSPCSSQPQQNLKDGAASEKEKEKHDSVEEGETDAKPWKLRTRKVVPEPSFKKGGKMQDEIVGYQKHESCDGPKSARLAGPAPGSERQRKVVEEKKRLWISLSREEIEDDVYSMTQSKPARRPRKRPKNVQKQLDNIFPGLYLVGMTADSYRIHESLK